MQYSVRMQQTFYAKTASYLDCVRNKQKYISSQSMCITQKHNITELQLSMVTFSKDHLGKYGLAPFALV